MLEAFMLSMFASVTLYKRTHANGFPELARYAIGGLLVLASYAILHPEDSEGLRRVALAFACTGAGVGIARVGGVLT
jgi:hypothetical protein